MSFERAEQVKYRFIVDIRTGLLKPGDKVDPIRVLCARYKTSVSTMHKVLRQLNEEGILEVSHGKATRVGKMMQNKITLF